MILTARYPVFTDCILGVVVRSSEKEGLRANTGGVVAVVANEEASRDGAEVELPRDSVRSERSARAGSLTDYTVSVILFRPCPQPTRRSLFYVGPKPLRQRDHVHMTLKELERPMLRASPSICPAATSTVHNVTTISV